MLNLQFDIYFIHINLFNEHSSKTLGGQCEAPHLELNTMSNASTLDLCIHVRESPGGGGYTFLC
jgi:hypothetical protein